MLAEQLLSAINAMTCVFITVLYLPCLKVIGFDADFRDNSCFRFMFHLGISDMVFVTFQFIFSIATLTGVIQNIPEWLNCSISPIVNSTWFSGTTILFFLSLNRFSVATGKLSNLFARKQTTILLLICWLYSIGWLIAMEKPEAKYCYYGSIKTFYYGLDNRFSEILKTFDWLHSQIVLWSAAVCYIFAYLAMRSERKAVTEGMVVDEISNSLRQREYQLFKQAASIFIYCWLFASQYWHLAPILHDGLEFKYAFALGNWLWIFNAAINPIVYLSMNKTIYNKVRQQFGMGVHGSVTTAVSIPKNKAQGDLIVQDL